MLVDLRLVVFFAGASVSPSVAAAVTALPFVSAAAGVLVEAAFFVVEDFVVVDFDVLDFAAPDFDVLDFDVVPDFFAADDLLVPDFAAPDLDSLDCEELDLVVLDLLVLDLVVLDFFADDVFFVREEVAAPDFFGEEVDASVASGASAAVS